LHELRQAARQWDSHGRSGDLGRRGATAQDALANQRRHVLDLSAVELAFLGAVKNHAARARRLRVFVVTTIFIVLAGVFAGGAYFTIQLSRANEVAQDREAAATRAAAEAQKARDEIQQKLDIIEQKEQARLKAEAEAKVAQEKAIKADENVKLSQEELEKANIGLRQALADAQLEKQRAQTEKAKAEAAAKVAEKASADAKAARASAEAAAAREKARADKLEHESKSIYNKDLRKKGEQGATAPGTGGLK
jgi:hypothetical protein